jgi:hypothetical protein
MTIKLLLSIRDQKAKHRKSEEIKQPITENMDIKIETYLRSVNELKDVSIGNILNELDIYIFTLFKSEVVFTKPIIKMLLRVQ